MHRKEVLHANQGYSKPPIISVIAYVVEKLFKKGVVFCSNTDNCFHLLYLQDIRSDQQLQG